MIDTRLIQMCEDYIINFNTLKRGEIHVQIVKFLSIKFKIKQERKILRAIQDITDNLDKCFHFTDDNDKNARLFGYALAKLFCDKIKLML